MTKGEIQKCCMISDHILNEYEEIIRQVAEEAGESAESPKGYNVGILSMMITLYDAGFSEKETRVHEESAAERR